MSLHPKYSPNNRDELRVNQTKLDKEVSIKKIEYDKSNIENLKDRILKESENVKALFFV